MNVFRLDLAGFDELLDLGDANLTGPNQASVRCMYDE
jgi:hypothetical protein